MSVSDSNNLVHLVSSQSGIPELMTQDASTEADCLGLQIETS
jgi:hypothetical protein